MRHAPRLWLGLAAATAVTVACGHSSSKSGDTPAPAPGGSGNHASTQKGPQQPPTAPLPTAGQPTPPAATPPGNAAPPAPATPATPATPAIPPELIASCNKAWDERPNNFKVGLEYTLKITDTTKQGNQPSTSSSWQARQTVTAVNAAGVTEDTAIKFLTPTAGAEHTTSRTVTKDSFLNDCTHGLTSSSDDGTTTTPVGAPQNVKVTVPAGTFDAIYTRAKVTGTDDDGNAYEDDQEMWTLGGQQAALGIFVKTTDHLTQQKNGAPYVEDRTSELTELKAP